MQRYSSRSYLNFSERVSRGWILRALAQTRFQSREAENVGKEKLRELPIPDALQCERAFLPLGGRGPGLGRGRLLVRRPRLAAAGHPLLLFLLSRRAVGLVAYYVGRVLAGRAAVPGT